MGGYESASFYYWKPSALAFRPFLMGVIYMRNLIYLRRASKIILPPHPGQTSINVIATLSKNLEQLGFQLSPELFQALQQIAQPEIESFYERLIKHLKKLVGAHRKFNPMYPNFPRQVMEMSKAELYFNALTHYITHRIPDTAASPREATEAAPRFRIIHLGNREDFEALCSHLMQASTPFSPQDVDDVRWLIAQYPHDMKRLVPSTPLRCKENIALMAAAFWKISNLSAFHDFCQIHIQTATDVLRLAVAASQGDVSLAEPCRFKQFSRPQRVALLDMLERTSDPTEDMLRWKPRWVRLGERLHPREYQKRFPKTAQAFDVLRNDLPFQTFNKQVEKSIAHGELSELIQLLEERPGEFARRLDHLLRIGVALQGSDILPDASESHSAPPLTPADILALFKEKTSQVSTAVLLQVMAHFRSRHELEKPQTMRAVFPKGEVAKIFALEKPMPTLPNELTQQVVEICEQALILRFAELPPLGRCYIDPAMRNYLVPFSQRSASKALRTLVRGSRLPLPLCQTLRFFIWWKNGRGRVDIDLSAAMFGDDYRYIDTLAYYNLKNFGAHHSGDIVDAPQGASEFIDVDVARCRQKGVRYVVMTINSYTSQAFCDLPECFAGWMSRQEPNSGEIFEPKLVVDKVDIASDTQICLPAIFDIQNNEVIWADIALKRYPRYVNNVHGNLRGVSLMLKAMTQLKKMDLYTLFELHAKARGSLVACETDAEQVFSPEKGITPFDLERISAEFL